MTSPSKLRALLHGSLVAVCLIAVCTLAVVLAGCDADYTHAIRRRSTGRDYLFNCTKGAIGRYSITDFFGNAVQDGTFDTATHNCIDVEDDVVHGIDPNSPSTTANARPGSLTAKATTSKPPLQYLLDVSVYNAIQVLDPSTLNFTEVDLPGGGSSAFPVGMAMTPDGKSIWVLQAGIPQNSFGAIPQPPGVSIFDTGKQAFVSSFSLPLTLPPEALRFSPDGTTAYIANNGAQFLNNSGVPANSAVTVVDVASQKVTKTIPIPKGAGSEAVSPDGLMLYTIFDNLGGTSALSAIDLTTQTVAASVSVPSAIKMFINPNGTRLYIYSLASILVYDTATLQQMATIPTVGFSFRNNFASFGSDGQTAWFCNCGYGIYYNVDLRTNKVINNFQTVNLGHGFMFSLQ